MSGLRIKSNRFVPLNFNYIHIRDIRKKQTKGSYFFVISSQGGSSVVGGELPPLISEVVCLSSSDILQILSCCHCDKRESVRNNVDQPRFHSPSVRT